MAGRPAAAAGWSRRQARPLTALMGWPGATRAGVEGTIHSCRCRAGRKRRTRRSAADGSPPECSGSRISPAAHRADGIHAGPTAAKNRSRRGSPEWSKTVSGGPWSRMRPWFMPARPHRGRRLNRHRAMGRARECDACAGVAVPAAEPEFLWRLSVGQACALRQVAVTALASKRESRRPRRPCRASGEPVRRSGSKLAQVLPGCQRHSQGKAECRSRPLRHSAVQTVEAEGTNGLTRRGAMFSAAA